MQVLIKSQKSYGVFGIINQYQTFIDTWKIHNTDYEIIILNKQNLHVYLQNIDLLNQTHSNERPERLSDMVRINILKDHGGIWLDASIICNKSLQWVLNLQEKHNVECVLYYAPQFTKTEFMNTSPVPENWFIACIKDSMFIKDWCDEFMNINLYENIDGYISKIVDDDKINIQNINSPNYLAMHVSSQKILQRPNKYNLLLLDAFNGPFLYQTDNASSENHEWNLEKSIPSLLSGKYNHVPLIKLRGTDRKYIEDNNLSLSLNNVRLKIKYN
jgi:hypothetical protein